MQGATLRTGRRPGEALGASKAKPLLELEKDFDEKELLTQRLTQSFDDGSATKRERRAADGLSIEALLCGVEELNPLVTRTFLAIF